MNGKSIDMTINAVGDYSDFKPARNGKKGPYALINQRSRSTATYDFSLTDTESGDPVTLDGFYFSVLDLDEGKRMKLRESTKVEGYAVSYLTEDTEIKMETEAGGAVRFDSSMPGTGKDNPKDPMDLNERQKNRVATFLFDTVSSWRITLGIGGGPPSGRNFMFAGKSSVVFC